MAKVIKIYLGCKHKKHRKLKLHWTIGPVSEQKFIVGPGVIHMFQMTDAQQAQISISAADKKGAKAEVQGVTFTSSDTNVVTVVPDSTDSNKAIIVAGLPGVAQVNVSADADLGDGTVILTGTLDVTVVAGQAATISVSAGAAEEQTEAPAGPPA